MLVIFDEPGIQIGLQLLDTPVNFLSEGDLIELFQGGLVKSLADTVGLRTLGFRLGVVDVFDRQV